MWLYTWFPSKLLFEGWIVKATKKNSEDSVKTIWDGHTTGSQDTKCTAAKLICLTRTESVNGGMVKVRIRYNVIKHSWLLGCYNIKKNASNYMIYTNHICSDGFSRGLAPRLLKKKKCKLSAKRQYRRWTVGATWRSWRAAWLELIKSYPCIRFKFDRPTIHQHFL